jgi:uncharacterized membrane protein
MKNNNIVKLVTAALMAAMTCVVTMILPIKIPLGNEGYIHPGDAFVMLSGIILGPLYGSLSAGIGSALSDLLLGYPHYIIPTFIIKAFAAFLCSYTYRRFHTKSIILPCAFSGIVVTAGYFLYENLIFGSPFAAAIVGVPFNILQSVLGIILVCISLPLLRKAPQIKRMMEEN